MEYDDLNLLQKKVFNDFMKRWEEYDKYRILNRIIK